MNASRKEFLAGLAAVGAAGLALSKPIEGRGASAGVPRLPPAPPRNRRPYSGLDWKNVIRVKTTSHGHCPHQRALDCYLKRGFGLLTMSNYYPSAPYVPASKMTEGYYRLHHEHGVSVNGTFVEGPFDWNGIVAPWKNDINPKFRGEYPFKEGRKLFKPLPPGILEAPNAEHHYFKMANGSMNGLLHLCAPGSAYASGTFDAHYRFKTNKGGYCYGSGERWETAIDRMIAGLIVPDGGGITINHPSWTKLNRAFMLEILDHDPRVLGIEVIEHGFNSEHYWDWALATGRQCFGFFVPDWAYDAKPNEVFGMNVLCVKERTVEACLRAYRQGNFYGALHGLGELEFTGISFDGKTVRAATDKPAVFKVITARGVVKESKGTSVSWSVPDNGDRRGPVVEVFARVKASAMDGCGEELFSQPFMLQ